MWDLLNAKKLLVVLVRFKQGSISLKKNNTITSILFYV